MASRKGYGGEILILAFFVPAVDPVLYIIAPVVYDEGGYKEDDADSKVRKILVVPQKYRRREHAAKDIDPYKTSDHRSETLLFDGFF